MSHADEQQSAAVDRSQLIAAKLVPPRLVGLVERPRLTELVEQVATKQLTIVKAGPGFGKTCLAASWASSLLQDGHLVAWLSLEPDDDGPTRFLFYLLHAMRRVLDPLGKPAMELLVETSLIRPHAVVTALINELVEIDQDVFLFLDDYHSIRDSEIHELLAFLLQHAPRPLHVVIGSRVEPPTLPLAQLRARNQLLEIDASALRFDPAETRQLLEREKLATLTSVEIRRLTKKTEGWPAMLRIVLSTARQEGADLAQRLHRMSSAQRPIGDYLEELLAGLPEEIFEFMLRTAILERFSATLAGAVTRIADSRRLLREMEALQLLLMALGGEGDWYRYHPLLRDYLTRRLVAEAAGEIPWLNRRAARWYADRQLWTDAIHHAIIAGDTDQALDWIESCAMALVKKGDLLTLLDWQRQFPPELMQSQLKLKLAIGWGMALAMRFDEALRLAKEIEQDADGNGPDREALRRECQTIRAVAAALQDDTEKALSLAQDVLEREADPWTANVASNVIRLGHWKAGELEAAYRAPWIPYSLDEDRRNVFSSVYRLCIQGLMEIQQLHLGAAETFYRKAMATAEQYTGPNSVATALPSCLMAEVDYERGRLDAAEELIIDRLPLIDATGSLEWVLRSYLVLVRTAVCRRDLERGYALLEQAESLGHAHRWWRLVAAVLVERLRLHLSEGRVAEAQACGSRLDALAAEHPVPRACAWSDIPHYAAVGRAFLAAADGRKDECLLLLYDLQRRAEHMNNHFFALQLAAHSSAVAFSPEAPDTGPIGLVLKRGVSEGIVQTILDQGLAIGAPLKSFSDSLPMTLDNRELAAYVRQLVASWQARYEAEPELSPRAKAAQSLSVRERTILQLIGSGGSNKDIARTLGIAPETVKSHVKNIFIKLAVEKRVQAVFVAQNLGLITMS